MPLNLKDIMYFARLDTIRCYAAFSVVFAHIFKIWTWQPETVLLFPLGHTGVVVFFVLSGFLITWLLLKEPTDKPIAQSFKQFYMRRTLRIFPIYYLYLLVVYWYNLEQIHTAGVYPWLYLTNIFIFKEDSWLLANSHLWSLSVEEQFYLVWPFFVLFFRQHHNVLLGIFSVICLLSMGTRMYLWANGYSESPQIEVFTLGCLDFLAIGGILALLYMRFGSELKRYSIPILLSSVAVYYFSYYLMTHFNMALVFWSLGQFAVAAAGVGLIIYALYTPDKQGVFHNKLTIHLGKVSYGVYLYHNIIVAHYADIAGFFGVSVGESIWVKIVLSLLFVMIVVELSFKLIEQPLLQLKNRFR